MMTPVPGQELLGGKEVLLLPARSQCRLLGCVAGEVRGVLVHNLGVLRND